MMPGMRRWRFNGVFIDVVFRLLRPTGVICRGPFATLLALRAKRRGLVERVVFDGRGAYAAEWEEYRLINDDDLIASVRQVEREALLECDHRIAVSQALVDHWRVRYGYSGAAHEVIPCTLAVSWRAPDSEHLSSVDGQVRLVYSGSSADWQSFRLLRDLLGHWLQQRHDLHVLFLSRMDQHIAELMQRYPGRVEVQWLDHGKVGAAMATCDYGIMVRERTVTNQVASPTKFAEYLACGLRVIISEGLGDLSLAVKRDDLGVVVKGDQLPLLPPVTPAQRAASRRYANMNFTKSAHDPAYGRLLEVLLGQ
jgi:hypothetical protein